MSRLAWDTSRTATSKPESATWSETWVPSVPAPTTHTEEIGGGTEEKNRLACARGPERSAEIGGGTEEDEDEEKNRRAGARGPERIADDRILSIVVESLVL